MNIQRVKQGGRITWYNGLFMICIAVVFLFISNLNMEINFRKAPELWGFFAHFNPEIAQLFFYFNIVVSILLISNGIFIMFLSDFIIKRKDKMAWVVLFFSGIVSWAGMLTISFLFQNIIYIIISFLGWGSFVFGMMWPIQYYWQKRYREY